MKTAFHLTTDCIDTEENKNVLIRLIRSIDIQCDFTDIVKQSEYVKTITKWMLTTGRLKQF